MQRYNPKPKIITLNQTEYPLLLKQLHKPPKTLYCLGNINCFNLPCLAVVGTRKHSQYAISVLEKILPPIINSGICIVSGLALGIDALAHKNCLDHKGKTIAVLGSGIYNIHPRSNYQLAQRIINSESLIISQFQPKEQPRTYNFPIRNSTIAGLCKATLVIEAPERSGALITAFAALDNNREVLAVPGNINAHASVGCNMLIKKGAIPVTKTEDVLEVFDLKQASLPLNHKDLTVDQRLILEKIAVNSLSIDELIIATKLSSAEILSNLTILEMNGRVQCVGNGKYVAIF